MQEMTTSRSGRTYTENATLNSHGSDLEEIQERR